MIGPQEQLEGSFIIIGLTKNYRFFLWKFVHFEKGFLDGFFAHITRNTHYHQMPLWQDVITRILVIKFRPKTRYQIIGLMKWLDHKSIWVAPFFVKEFLTSTCGTQKIAQTVRSLDHLVNQTFRGSSWSPTERLVKGC